MKAVLWFFIVWLFALVAALLMSGFGLHLDSADHTGQLTPFTFTTPEKALS